MSLELFLHPLSSYCHKVLIALYEYEIPFQAKRVDDPALAGEFAAASPLGKFPVLRDATRGHLVPESTIIIEYLTLHYPGRSKLIPDDPEAAWQVRLRDRFFDNYLHTPMQAFAAEKLRPPERKAPSVVAEARALYMNALALVDTEMADKTWAAGDAFTMADCSAGPALFFGNRFYGPIRDTHPNAYAYLERLTARPSYARALREAAPFLHLIAQWQPMGPAPP